MSSAAKLNKEMPKRRVPRMPPGDVPLLQLKRELERGYEFFMDRRPNLHGTRSSYLDFSTRSRRTA